MATPIIDPVFTQFGDVFGKDIFHFKASTADFTGFGSDYDRSIAFIKAAAECAERHFILELQAKTSNGMAAHSDVESAKTAAQLELLERDAFLTLWLTGKSPEWLDVENLDLDSESLNSLRIMQNHGFRIQLGLSAVGPHSFFAAGVLLPGDAREGQFGGVFSSAGGESLRSSLRSVLIELRRAATVIETRRMSGLIYNPASAEETKDGRSTFEYYLNPDHFSDIESFIRQQGTRLYLDGAKISFDVFNCEISRPNLKFWVARAISPDVQDLYFGMPHAEDLNLDRLGLVSPGPYRSKVMPLP